MFMHKSKKGFTIVELVIVIAVIAILAAVLIPTFSNLVKKANQSADIQGARQMDTVLQAESAAKKPETLKDVIIILDAADFNIKSLVPLTKNHTFYWDETSNKIVLYSTEDGILYPEIDSFDPAAATSHNLNDGKGHIKVEVKTAAAVIEALTNGQSVTLSEDVELTQAVSVAPGSDVTINLNGKTLTTTTEGEDHLYAIINNGTVTIENGTINARGIKNGNTADKMTLKNVTLNTLDTNGGGIWSNSGEIVIESGTYTSEGNVSILGNAGGTLTVNGGTFGNSSGGDVWGTTGTTIKGGTFENLIEKGHIADGYEAVSNADGSVTITKK